MSNTSEDIVRYAEASNEAQEPVEPGDVEEADEDVRLQTELLASGEQQRDPVVEAPAPLGEGEHQMKGAFAEVNPIGPANEVAAAEHAASVALHTSGSAPASLGGSSVVTPGVNEYTDLAIAEDTRVAGGREVLGDTGSAPDVEGVVASQVASIQEDLVEAHDLGAAVVLPDPDAEPPEVPEFTDRVAVFDEDGNLRSEADRKADLEEAVEAPPAPEVADLEAIEEYEPEVETDPEALAEAQKERTEEEVEEAVDVGETGETTVIADPESDPLEPGTTEEPEEGDEEGDAEDGEGEDGPPPKSALKGEWVDYAAGLGYDRDECEALTKEELIAQFGGD